MLPEEISILIGELSKQVALPNVGGYHLIGWRSESNKKAEEVWIHSVWLIEFDQLLFSRPSCAWFSGLQTQTEIYTIGCLAP